ncbi:MAG: hypothetical protein JXR37_31985 [Kiritimatiellae bacterium]|nr:hypothetical protein [Kiritimatiellia bacterium]
MIAHHVHHALAQVRQLQERILEKRSFRGYSGKARMLSGTAALGAAVIMASKAYPDTHWMHLLGWGAVLGIGLVLNYGYLAYWFLFNPGVRRNTRMLKPAIDAVPALAIGAVLTLVLLFRGEYDLLFGIWMSLYGLAQVAYRNSLPRLIYVVGLGYIICGSYFLLFPHSFVNPWPMGIIFFAGEWAGGSVLYAVEKRKNQQEPSGH